MVIFEFWLSSENECLKIRKSPTQILLEISKLHTNQKEK
jgi:hypothetical protein